MAFDTAILGTLQANHHTTAATAAGVVAASICARSTLPRANAVCTFAPSNIPTSTICAALSATEVLPFNYTAQLDT